MNKIINPKLNIAFAIYIVLMPMVMSFFALFDISFELPYQLVMWGIVYFICITISLIVFLLKGGRLSFKFKNSFVVILLLMLIWIIISNTVNATFNLQLIVYITYFLIFLCFFMLDKKILGVLLNTLLVVVSISCVMGFIDPYNKFMPGINNSTINLALHFTNPNYASYIVSSLAIICFMLFNKADNKKYNIFYYITYLIFAVYLFMNGTFIAITSLILLEIVVQLVIGLRYKKLQYKMLILFMLLIPICFLVDLIPNIAEIRTCDYNYFIECVAMFDNIFNTNILSWFGVENVMGANGWDRDVLLSSSGKSATSSVKMFLFGGGAGFFYNLRPHNWFLSLMLDFGIIVPILYAVFFVMLFIKLFKSKFEYNKLCFAISIVCFLLCYLVGSIVCNSYYVFMIVLALLFKNLYGNQDENN